jgi:hypothetical protein
MWRGIFKELLHIKTISQRSVHNLGFAFRLDDDFVCDFRFLLGCK